MRTTTRSVAVTDATSSLVAFALELFPGSRMVDEPPWPSFRCSLCHAPDWKRRHKGPNPKCPICAGEGVVLIRPDVRPPWLGETEVAR